MSLLLEGPGPCCTATAVLLPRAEHAFSTIPAIPQCTAAMGAHGTVDMALANIAAFNQAAAQQALQARKDKKAAAKAEAEGKRKRSKSKDKDKKHKHRKSAKRRRTSSSGSSSDSEAAPVSASEQLARSQGAVRTLREILAKHNGIRKDLREVGLCDAAQGVQDAA